MDWSFVGGVYGTGVMPLYCYLCGLIGHMEKKYSVCFMERFIDPGKDFPFGEWLKTAPRGEGSGRVRMPLQPIPSPMALHSRTLLGGFKFLALGGAIREEKIHHLW